MRSIISTFFLLFIVNGTLHAQDVDHGYCQNAQTTADLMDCIGTRYTAENANMNTLYKELADASANNPDFLTRLKTNQDEWIKFRDDLCALSGSVYNGGSLERVEKISCMAKATSVRSAQFESILKSMNVNNIPVFASPPRWTNVLTNDHPGIFWGLGMASDADTDCDGINEKIILGIKEAADTEIENTAAFEKYIVIADSPRTGRPIVHMKMLADGMECHRAPVTIERGATNVENEKCEMTLTSDTVGCEDLTVTYDTSTEKYKITKKAKPNE